MKIYCLQCGSDIYHISLFFFVYCTDNCFLIACYFSIFLWHILCTYNNYDLLAKQMKSILHSTFFSSTLFFTILFIKISIKCPFFNFFLFFLGTSACWMFSCLFKCIFSEICEKYPPLHTVLQSEQFVGAQNQKSFTSIKLFLQFLRKN